MKAVIRAGMAIDIPSLDEITSGVESTIKRLAQPQPKGAWVRHAGGVLWPASPTTGVTVIKIGRPPHGKIWLVNRITVIVYDITTDDYLPINLANWQAVAFSGQLPTVLTPTTLLSLPPAADAIGVIPVALDQPYPVMGNDTLYVAFNVGVAFTNAVQVTATATMYETDDSNLLQRGV